MCGIVLAGGNLIARDVELFGRLLYADIVRGEHSTGVFAGFRPFGHDPILKLRKAAVPADIFLRRKELWGEVREHAVPSKTVANSFTTAYPKFMVGHNRYATQGAINDTNAHPFNHGKITLVHNGTLTDQSLLPDHKNFAVDSENVAWSINKIGIDETIQKLNGAFTLVWHNAEDSTVNIIRNEERPFHLVETTGGDWFGASEEDMLLWLINRKKFAPTIKRHFECEVGIQYVFDVSEGFKFKEERKHTLPTFRSYSYTGRTGGYWYDQWDDDYGYGNGRGTSTTSRNQSNSQSFSSSSSSVTPDSRYKQFNDMLESHGINVKMGEQLRFESFQFDQYPKSLGKGKMTGYTGTGEYIEVQAHGTDMGIFVEGAEYDGKIISCYEQNYILTIIVQDPKPAHVNQTLTLGDLVNSAAKETPIPDTGISQEELNEEYYGDEEEDDGNEVEVTLNGEVYSKKEWEGNDSLNTCANCSSPIPFDDVIDTVVDNGAAFCHDCAKHYNLLPPETEEPIAPNRFVCQSCANELPEDLESAKPGVCIPCLCAVTKDNNTEMARQQLIEKYDRWESNLMPEEVVTPLLPKPTEVSLGEISLIRKKLKNNLLVTVKQWMKMNNCGWCQKPIQWVDAEATEFVGQQPCCPGCSKKLEMGILPKPINKDK